MNTGEDLDQFKKRVERQELKRARSIAVVYGVLAVVELISSVYAFERGEAADVAERTAVEWKMRAEAAEQLAIKHQVLAEEARKAAVAALENCEKRERAKFK